MLATLALLLLISLDAPQDDVKLPSPDEQFRALRDAYQAAYDTFVKASEEAKTDEEQAKVLDHPGRQPRNFAPGFMALARKYPGTTAAEDSLLWVGTHIFLTADSEEAKRTLSTEFIRSPKLGPALGWQGHYTDFFEGSEAFFRKILAENPHRDIQGLACYWLARHLSYKAQCVRLARKKSDFGLFDGKDIYADVYGVDWANRLRRLDPDALDRESDTLFERVARYYADVPHNDKRRIPGGTLGDAAASYLHEHRDLAVGKPAPEFEGDDLDGKRFRLEDYRGKVVLLDFGSHFYCGSCRAMYPLLQTLSKRLEGRPFAVVSINAEPEKALKDLKDAWTEEGNSWRCLYDGTWEGPIQKAWNIQRFPTLYLIDARGTIRYKDFAGLDMDWKIDKLVSEAEASK